MSAFCVVISFPCFLLQGHKQRRKRGSKYWGEVANLYSERQVHRSKEVYGQILVGLCPDLSKIGGLSPPAPSFLCYWQESHFFTHTYVPLQGSGSLIFLWTLTVIGVELDFISGQISVCPPHQRIVLLRASSLGMLSLDQHSYPGQVDWIVMPNSECALSESLAEYSTGCCRLPVMLRYHTMLTGWLLQMWWEWHETEVLWALAVVKLMTGLTPS